MTGAPRYLVVALFLLLENPFVWLAVAVGVAEYVEDSPRLYGIEVHGEERLNYPAVAFLGHPRIRGLVDDGFKRLEPCHFFSPSVSRSSPLPWVRYLYSRSARA